MFADGGGGAPLLLRVDGRYFCCQMTWAETEAFCAAAGIPIPDWPFLDSLCVDQLRPGQLAARRERRRDGDGLNVREPGRRREVTRTGPPTGSPRHHPAPPGFHYVLWKGAEMMFVFLWGEAWLDRLRPS